VIEIGTSEAEGPMIAGENDHRVPAQILAALIAPLVPK
jgi:hypothetical protein